MRSAVAKAFEPAEAAPRHVPVLRQEVVEAMAPAAGEVYIDGTFGAGGYSRALLEATDCRVIGIDRDPEAIMGGLPLVGEMNGRLSLVQSRFSDLANVARELGLSQVNGVVLDVGVSSMQIDTADRGFSFRFDGPLDMRMSPTGPTAADLVNTLDEKDLAALIRALGEERKAGSVARAIVAERAKGEINSTAQLAKVVEGAVGMRMTDTIHPATRTFQALRIAVNDELGELARALFAAETILAPGGRLVVVSFHSLEDRIVKTFMSDRSRSTSGLSRHLPAAVVPEQTFITLTKGVATASEDEINSNPRARSARLRAAERTKAAPREESDLLAYGVPRLPALARFFEHT